MSLVKTVHVKIADELVGLGGHLECTVCGYKQELGAIGGHLATGWPKHCSYTMTWKTAQQLAGQETA